MRLPRSGHWDKDKKHGLGRYSWGTDSEHAGDYYQGQMENNQMAGWGASKMADGGYHKGLYARGRRNGWGVQREYDGTQYMGQWVDDNLDGFVVTFNAYQQLRHNSKGCVRKRGCAGGHARPQPSAALRPGGPAAEGTARLLRCQAQRAGSGGRSACGGGDTADGWRLAVTQQYRAGDLVSTRAYQESDYTAIELTALEAEMQAEEAQQRAARVVHDAKSKAGRIRDTVTRAAAARDQAVYWANVALQVRACTRCRPDLVCARPPP